MRGDRHVPDATAIVDEQHQDEHAAVGRGRDYEEIDRHDGQRHAASHAIRGHVRTTLKRDLPRVADVAVIVRSPSRVCYTRQLDGCFSGSTADIRSLPR
jgi:hypothetical protein